MSRQDSRPRITLVVPRGEAARNFLYSRTLAALAEAADVDILSVIDDDEFSDVFRPHADRVLPLREHSQPRLAASIRQLTENAHDRRLWSAVAQNNWRLRDMRANENGSLGRRRIVRALSRALANEPSLRTLTRLEQSLAFRQRTSREFDRLFAERRPDLVFNCSHIHGLAGELPLRVAHRMGIPTAGFIFSWDNLTSRSRIFVPYDDYLVWHEGMKRQLLGIYPWVDPDSVHVTGTPQFDYHFDAARFLSRTELSRRIGIDPERPFVLYTTGISNHFYDEHLHVEEVIRILRDERFETRPQLVVRTYVKGTSEEMLAIGQRREPDVVFPEVLWEPRWQTPRFEDLEIYSNLLRHCALGINAASTVSLELLMLDKPVINLDFDPPGSDLPWDMGYDRHIQFDHYKPVADSGAVMVARSVEDMRRFIRRGLEQPQADQEARQLLLGAMFGSTLDGQAGERVAKTLLRLTSGASPKS